MKFSEFGGYVRINLNDDFDPVKIFECGQCFRWNPDGTGAYIGVAKGKAARVCLEGDNILISGSANDFSDLWRDYFDLDRNYADIRHGLCVDDYMQAASDYGAGIRILRQDRWEGLCSFIISQCNNIPRIKKIVETLCEGFGDPIEFQGKTYYSFPSAEKIAALSETDLAPLRCGYRAPYILDAAAAVAEGKIDLELLAGTDYKTALAALKSLNGVGDKVANCVILFSLQMLSAFPIDVWIKKAVMQHYGKDFDPAVFGDYAGIAQQYMFYYQREENGIIKP